MEVQTSLSRYALILGFKAGQNARPQTSPSIIISSVYCLFPFTRDYPKNCIRIQMGPYIIQAQCEFFIILCPALEHAEHRKMLSLETWAERGGCVGIFKFWLTGFGCRVWGGGVRV